MSSSGFTGALTALDFLRIRLATVDEDELEWNEDNGGRRDSIRDNKDSSWALGGSEVLRERATEIDIVESGKTRTK